MSDKRKREDRLEEVMMELSQLANDEELPEQYRGELKAAEMVVAKVFEKTRNARHIEEWP